MRRKKKNPYKLLLYFFIVISTFILFYFVINDKEKKYLYLTQIKDLTANILHKNNNLEYNNKLLEEIENDYKDELDNLKKSLKLNELNSDKKFINATVIKRSTPYWYNIITINKGSKDKIKKGYAVINNDGLVGKVINVGKNTSDIKLLISNVVDNYISCKFNYEGKEYYGLISNYKYNSNELIIKNVVGDFDKDKIKNINIVTSGLSDSFSSGLIIGKIKTIKKDTFGISNTIIASPVVNFDNINIVSVVGENND